jgi:hypothetical protein
LRFDAPCHLLYRSTTEHLLLNGNNAANINIDQEKVTRNIVCKIESIGIREMIQTIERKEVQPHK